MTEAQYQTMRRLTQASFWRAVDHPLETGCLLLIARNGHADNPSLLVHSVLEAKPGDLVRQGPDELVFSSHFLRRAMLVVRRLNLAGLLTVHTHPFADTEVAFSYYDNRQDPLLMQNLYEQQPEGVFGSVVLGKQAICARYFEPDCLRSIGLSELVIVGEQMTWQSLNGSLSPAPPVPAAIFDRSLALTGEGAMAQLASLRVGVVGASGTGSLVMELLLRAGVGEMVVFEFDTIEEPNLNRILHARQRDAVSQTSKALRMKEALDECELPTRITVVTGGDVTQTQVAQELRQCDLIFGCLDNRDWPRLVLTEIAYQYLIPYIDLGTEISTGVQSVDARVSYLAPGRACLLCSNLISTERLALEGMATEERDRNLAMGYSQHTPLSAPAVMDLNMRAASMGVLLMRHLMQPFLAVPLPSHFKESITNGKTRKITVTANPNCHLCGTDARTGLGDAIKLTTR